MSRAEEGLGRLASQPETLEVDGRLARRLVPEGAGRETLVDAILSEVDRAIMPVRTVLAAVPDGPRLELALGGRRLRGPGDPEAALVALEVFATEAGDRAVAILVEGAAPGVATTGGLSTGHLAERLRGASDAGARQGEMEAEGPEGFLDLLKALASAISVQRGEEEVEAVLGDGGLSDPRTMALGGRGNEIEDGHADEDDPWLVCWSGEGDPPEGAALLAVWPREEVRVLAALPVAALPEAVATFRRVLGGPAEAS